VERDCPISHFDLGYTRRPSAPRLRKRLLDIRIAIIDAQCQTNKPNCFLSVELRIIAMAQNDVHRMQSATFRASPSAARVQLTNLTPHVVPRRHTTWQRFDVKKPSTDKSKSEEKT